MSGVRLFFHVQHLLGIGHRRRAAAIARACRDAGFQVTLTDGGITAEAATPDGVSELPLPPARAADAAFSRIVDETGREIDETWMAARRAALLAGFEAAAPDILLVEGFPFARRRFRFELIPLLEAARAHGLPVACSVRDVIQPKRPDRLGECLDWLARYFDAVLVHGDPDFVPFEASFPAAERIAPPLHYTGYVGEPATEETAAAGGTPDAVVVSGGGGAVAEPLLAAANEARTLCRRATGRWRLILGPNLPDAAARPLLQQAGGALAVDRWRGDFRSLLSGARVSVSQAGYNTVCDLAATGAPAVLAPFSRGGQQEQTLRAKALEARGRAVVVSEDDLNPAALARAVDEAWERPRLPTAFAQDGARRSAELLSGIVGRAGRVGLARTATNI